MKEEIKLMLRGPRDRASHLWGGGELFRGGDAVVFRDRRHRGELEAEGKVEANA